MAYIFSTGFCDAKLDRQPVLAITALQIHDPLHTFTQQDVELDKLYMDVAVYNARVMGPNHVENIVELACRTAIAYRGPMSRFLSMCSRCRSTLAGGLSAICRTMSLTLWPYRHRCRARRSLHVRHHFSMPAISAVASDDLDWPHHVARDGRDPALAR